LNKCKPSPSCNLKTLSCGTSVKMNKITITADGSNTLYNETIGEHYHSKHGALQESKHVFIDAGLKHVAAGRKDISILEIGFGTGLNFLLTLAHAVA
jgi:tRNA U34 5-methylaminomethyl-2-thiouridine-forming methyltransferase MnmC